MTNTSCGVQNQLSFADMLLGAIKSFYHRHLTLRLLNKQAHLRVLANQLSPHFVFNVLNNLRVTLMLDPINAAPLARDLSSLLDGITTLSQS